jgi:alpha-tubulin suppressor-like RCC1 family protein
MIPPPVLPTPKQIPASIFANTKAKVIQVALGSHHALALTSDHEVFSWGRSSAALGLGEPPADDVHVPQRVTEGLADNKVVRIGAGGTMSAAITGSSVENAN